MISRVSSSFQTGGNSVTFTELNNWTLRPDFTSKLVHVLAFGIPKFYIAPYDKIKHELVNLSSNCDVKSGLRNVKIKTFKN